MRTVPAGTIVSKNKSSEWFGAEYNMNIYRGCCHGCIYCDSRSDCYRIENFDEVRAKEDALRIIRDDLRRKTSRGVVATGAMSDPYNPFEREQKLTRGALELVCAHGFGAAIATKSRLVTRDTDILRGIAKNAPVIVKVTITAADDGLRRLIEPNAPATDERFEALRELADGGVYCGVLLMPMLPFITDTRENVVEILRRARASGARFVYPSFGVTLRGNQRDYYYSRLDRHFPGLSGRYVRTYGDRYSCGSPNAQELWHVFKRECDSLGLLYGMKAIIADYKAGYGDGQMSLFD